MAGSINAKRLAEVGDNAINDACGHLPSLAHDLLVALLSPQSLHKAPSLLLAIHTQQLPGTSQACQSLALAQASSHAARESLSCC